MATENEAKRSPGGRSPAYPFIPLDKAIQRAAELKKAIGRSDTRVLSAVHHWSYGPKSSGGIQTIAALKHFGLLEDSGSGPDRRAALSDRALRILLDERPNSEERARLIKLCALTPKMHDELWNRWGAELPVDEEIRHYLIFDRDFNENGARDLIAEYKSTLDYAGLLDSDTVPLDDGDIIPTNIAREDGQMQTPTPERPTVRPMHFAGGDVTPAAVVAEGVPSLVLYNNRIRISADVDLDGAKDLIRKLQKRIDLLEEEIGSN